MSDPFSPEAQAPAPVAVPVTPAAPAATEVQPDEPVFQEWWVATLNPHQGD